MLLRALPLLSLVALGLVACSSTGDDAVRGDDQNWDTESPTDEAKSTHLWVTNHGAAILAKHTADVPTAANTLAWMSDATCKANWQRGLLEADFLAPYNGATADLDVPDGSTASNIEGILDNVAVLASHATWMTHFYDPKTSENYLGFKTSSDLVNDVGHPYYSDMRRVVEGGQGQVPVEAHGAVLYRVGRAMKLLAGQNVPKDHAKEPNLPKDRGCYELGLALHYLTDLTQPMHAANFAATERPRLLHSNWESYAEQVQAGFVRQDWSSAPSGQPLDRVVLDVAQQSRAHFKNEDDTDGPLFSAILDAYRAGGTWDAQGYWHFDSDCSSAMAELVAGRLVGGGSLHLITLDLPSCWKNNDRVLAETGRALGDAQEYTAKFLAALDLPRH